MARRPPTESRGTGMPRRRLKNEVRERASREASTDVWI